MAFEELECLSEDSDESMDVRLEMKIKNNILLSAIHGKYRSVLGMCKANKKLTGGDYVTLCKLLCFKISPYLPQRADKHGIMEDRQYRPTCVRLQEVLGLPAEYLFPDELYAKFMGTETSRVIMVSSFGMLPGLQQQKILALSAPDSDPIEQLDAQELRERIEEVLKTLPGRLPEVIRLRFGIPDGKTHTLDECAAIFGISRALIQQTEVKALNKLRHPSRASRLESFVEP